VLSTQHVRWPALLAVVLGAGAIGLAQTPDRVYPGARWDRVATPSSIGYCQAGLDAATEKAKAMPTTGVMAVAGGRVLWQHGDVQTLSYLASVR
jgi:hypothetical protein